MAHIQVLGMGGTPQQGMVNGKIAPKYSLEQLLEFVFHEGISEVEAKEIIGKDHIDSNNLDEMDLLHLFDEVYRAELDREVIGSLVIMGTDRMADMAALCEFGVRPVRKPIIFTGAMQTIEDEETDAKGNIKNAMKLIRRMHDENVIMDGSVYAGNIVVMGAYGIYAHSAYKISTIDDCPFVCSAEKPVVFFRDGRMKFNKVKKGTVGKNPVKVYKPKFEGIGVENLLFGYKPDMQRLSQYEAIIYVGTGDGNISGSMRLSIERLAREHYIPQFICSSVPIRNTVSNYEAGIVPDGVCQSVMPVHTTYAKLAVILGSVVSQNRKEKRDYVIKSFKNNFSNEFLHIGGLYKNYSNEI